MTAIARRYAFGESQEEIANALSMELGKKVSQGTVSELYSKGRESGLISIRIDTDAIIRGKPDRFITENLKSAFDLHHAIAIGAGKLSDDDLHVALANELGDVVRTLISNKDHVAVAGGRAICRLVQVIGSKPSELKDVVVSPLGGRISFGSMLADQSSEKSDPNRSAQPINPDYSALLLALNLIGSRRDTGIRWSQVSKPLFEKSEKEAMATKASHCAFLVNGQWNWNLPVPKIALVGVGVLSTTSAHRISAVLRLARQDDKSEFKAVKAAMDKAAQMGLPPFADVANRFFPTLPMPIELVGRNLRDTSKDLLNLLQVLEQLNQRSITMDWEHLAAIPEVVVIAGGNEKKHALWTLMLADKLRGKKIVKYLATDAETGRALLSAWKQFQSASAEVKEWYQNLVHVFFRIAFPRAERG